MTKIILSNVGSLIDATTAAATINANNAIIQTAFDNNLSRDGTLPNVMGSRIDMNSHELLNVGAPTSSGSAARLVDVVTNPTILVPPTGTSGHTVPFLDGTNTWSGNNTFPTQAASDNSTKAATTAYADKAILYNILSFTRVLSVASGNVAYTGLGFRPRLIQFQTGISGGSSWSSIGQANGSGSTVFNNGCVEYANNPGGTNGTFFQGSIAGIQRDNAAGTNYQQFTVVALGSDGFTLSWVKNGSPTLTASINAICWS